MSSLDKFLGLVQQGLKHEANACLKKALDENNEVFFEELRKRKKSILKFPSFHAGNPDITAVDNVKGEGDVYLLSKWVDVKHALENFSMRPYTRETVDQDGNLKKGSFILSESDKVKHEKRRKAVVNALIDPELLAKINASIDEAWNGISVLNPPPPHYDVRLFARTAALKFTGKFFGIGDDLIFGGSENLEKWSEIAYENFIWKLHGRHFGDPNPEMNGALGKIAKTVVDSMKIIGPKLGNGSVMSDGNVISRLLTTPGISTQIFSNEEQVVANIVGLIQGLVDNVMTGSCFALNQIYQMGDKEFQYISALSNNFDGLKLKVREMHKLDPPSPYLPRYGKLGDLPSFDKSIYSEDPDTEVTVSCAIGSAITDNSTDPSITDNWDIRMGSGIHACVGNYIGDDITTAIVAKVLEEIPSRNTPLYERRWSWVVKKFVIPAT